MRTAARAFAWGVALVAISSCSVHPEGITDLIGDGFSYVNFPGRRVFSSPVATVGLDVARDGSYLALSISDGGELMIGDLNGTSHCNAGPASTFRLTHPYFQSGSYAHDWVAYLSDADANGWGTLRFVSHDCTKRVQGPVGVTLLTWLSFDPPRFLVRARVDSYDAGERTDLLVCDPSSLQGPCRTLARIDSIAFDGVYLWTREYLDGARRLVARNSSLEPTLVVGTDVSEFILGVNLVGVAYIEQGRLRIVAAGASTVIAEDACELRAVLSRSRAGAWFTYRAPCRGGKLMLYDGRSMPLARGATTPVIGEQQQGSAPVFFYVSEPTVLTREPPNAEGMAEWFRANYGVSAPVSAGTLTVTRAPGATEFGPTQAWLGSLSWNYGTRVRVLSQFDGTRGKLVEWELSDKNERALAGPVLWEGSSPLATEPSQDSVRELAAGISDFSWGWAIEDADSGTRNFLDLGPTDSVRLALANVEDRGQVFNEYCIIGSLDCLTSKLDDDPAELRVLLSDVSGSSGKLWLLARREARAALGAAELLDDEVYRRGYAFLRHGDAVVYFRKFSESRGTGELTIRFVDTFDPYRMKNVASWMELTGDSPGLLYTTRGGAKPGLWFAPLR